MSWQSDEIKEALAVTNPVYRLIAVFDLLHPMPLSDSKHGLVDCPALVRDATVAYESSNLTDRSVKK